MELQTTSIRLYRESLSRLTGSHTQFLDKFYCYFMGIDSGSDVASFFRGRNLGRIKHKLMTTLELVADNANDVPGTDMYLELLGRIHKRRHITLEHFISWKYALVKAAAECDPAFNETIRTAWEDVLDDIMEKMYGEDAIDAYNYNASLITVCSTGNKSVFVQHPN